MSIFLQLMKLTQIFYLHKKSFFSNFCLTLIFVCCLFVEYATNGSLYDFLQTPQSELLTFENTMQWATDIARGKLQIY